MKWVEMIRLRLAEGKMKLTLEATMQRLINGAAGNIGQTPIRVFRREKLASDVCVILFHNGKKPKTGGSALGLHLAAALMEVGLVNHTIWDEFK